MDVYDSEWQCPQCAPGVPLRVVGFLASTAGARHLIMICRGLHEYHLHGDSQELVDGWPDVSPATVRP